MWSGAADRVRSRSGTHASLMPGGTAVLVGGEAGRGPRPPCGASAEGASTSLVTAAVRGPDLPWRRRRGVDDSSRCRWTAGCRRTAGIRVDWAPPGIRNVQVMAGYRSKTASFQSSGGVGERGTAAAAFQLGQGHVIQFRRRAVVRLAGAPRWGGSGRRPPGRSVGGAGRVGGGRGRRGVPSARAEVKRVARFPAAASREVGDGGAVTRRRA